MRKKIKKNKVHFLQYWQNVYKDIDKYENIIEYRNIEIYKEIKVEVNSLILFMLKKINKYRKVNIGKLYKCHSPNSKLCSYSIQIF